MATLKLEFDCPKCRHRYTVSGSTGPRSICPNCRHEPTIDEFMGQADSRLPWKLFLSVIAVLIVVCVILSFW